VNEDSEFHVADAEEALRGAGQPRGEL